MGAQKACCRGGKKGVEVIRTIRAWWNWNREANRLRREANRLRLEWWRTHYVAQDVAAVYRDTPGAWRAGGEIDQAQQASKDAHAAMIRADQAVERWERT